MDWGALNSPVCFLILLQGNSHMNIKLQGNFLSLINCLKGISLNY